MAEEEEQGKPDILNCSSWKSSFWFWLGLIMALIVRIICLLMGSSFLLGRRVEIATPVTSLTRLAEGYWLKQVGISSYAGSTYHGSPLLLAVLGPIISSRIGGQHLVELTSSFVFVSADFVSALLLRKIGEQLQSARAQQIALLKLNKIVKIEGPTNFRLGDVVAFLYLWNPFTIVTCVGGCTSSIENLMIILALHGAVLGNTPLAAFGWAMATHLALYPAFLFIPIALTLSYGVDHPSRKIFETVPCQIPQEESGASFPSSDSKEEIQSSDVLIPSEYPYRFKTKNLFGFIVWSLIWWLYILVLCKIAVRPHGGLCEMFSETYGFILTVEDLSPNLGVFWYFFTEVFDFFRPFFLLVFHANILFMILPLTIRLHHRPIFLAFVLLAISAMLKSYPSVGDAAVYLGLMPLFTNELSGMRFTFFLLNGYLGIALLSPIMYNLWIWRGTGNANFYFAMALAYACIQLIMIVESVSTVLLYDRNLKKLKSASFHFNSKKKQGNECLGMNE